MENKYVELAVGSPGNRGIIVPVKDIGTELSKYNSVPVFRSYYMVDDSILKHIKGGRRTLRGYKGDYYLDRILFDIDKGSDSNEECLNAARNFYHILTETHSIPEDCIHPWFSGTGYHIVIPNIFGFEASHELPRTVKYTVKHYFPEADAIYDGARLIRLGFTPNEKTLSPKLYKVPVSPRELLHEDHTYIMKKAESVKDLEMPTRFPECDVLLDPIIPKKKEIKPHIPIQNPSKIATCIQTMIAEGPIKGSRHHKVLRVASYMKSKGLPEQFVSESQIAWATNLEAEEVIRLVHDVYSGGDTNNGYKYGCNDWLMDKYCDSKCIYYPAKQEGGDILIPILSVKELEKRARFNIKKDLTDVTINLNDFWALGSDYFILPGQLVMIGGETGMGKTAFAQNICMQSKIKTLYLTLEVEPELITRRFQQMVHNMSAKDVLKHWKDDMSDKLHKGLEHLDIGWFPPKLHELKELVAYHNPAVLVLDTIDMVKVSKYIHNQIEKIDTIIEEMRSIATNQGIIVMGISHISKSEGRSGILDVHSFKGSSTIEQKSDKVIMIDGVANSTARMVKSHKSRDESGFVANLMFDPRTFKFKDEVRNER